MIGLWFVIDKRQQIRQDHGYGQDAKDPAQRVKDDSVSHGFVILNKRMFASRKIYQLPRRDNKMFT